MEFKVGDNVVYPSQGAGTVQEKVTRVVLGEAQEYLKISFIKGDMEILVPLKKGEEVGLRHTVTAGELAQLFEAMAAGDIALPSQWTLRYRAEQEILARGNAYDLAKMIGALAARDLQRGLSATERQVLEDAKSMLASELAIVEETSLAEALERIEEVIAERS